MALVTRPHRLLLVGVALCIALTVFAVARTVDRAQANPPGGSWSVDVDPGGGIDVARAVPVGSTFSVDILFDSYDGAPWWTYNLTVQYNESTLDLIGVPSDWTSAPVPGVSGGNLATFPNGVNCGNPDTNSNGAFTRFSVSCNDPQTDGTPSIGGISQLAFRCQNPGTTAITIVTEPFESFLIEDPLEFIVPHAHDGFITCGPPPATTLTATSTWTPTATSTPIPSGFTVWSVDAVPGGGVETSRTVPVGAAFSVELVVGHTGPAWSGYQTTIDFDDARLNAVSFTNTHTFPGSFHCSGVPNPSGVSPDLASGVAMWTVNCHPTSSPGSSSGGGTIIQFHFVCGSAGTTDITVRDAFDTGLDGPGVIPFNDEQHGATIECVGATATPTTTPEPTPGARTILAIDASPGGSVDAARTVAVGQTFGIDVVLTEVVGPWSGYQLMLDYHDGPLDPALPAKWEGPPASVDAAGNLISFSGGSDCFPDATSSSSLSDDDAGLASVLFACLPGDIDAVQNVTGPLARLAFTCESPGIAELNLRNINEAFMLSPAPYFETSNDFQYDAFITCVESLPTFTHTPTPPGTPTPTPFAGTPPAISKSPEGNDNNVDAAGDLPLANLFLCEDTDGAGPICSGPNEGKLTFTEMGFSPEPLGAFEFQIKFDHKIFDIDLECVTEQDPGPACTGDFDEDSTLNTDADTWDIQLSAVLQNPAAGEWGMDKCFRNVTENYINFACVSSSGPLGPGISGGPFPLADVTLHPDADLRFRLRPGNDNGVVRVLLDENCELVDQLGHPQPGSVAGGLTSVCGDLAVTVRILEGDLDLDCDVDLGDAQAIAQRYGMTLGLFLYHPWYDLEPNITDFDIDAKDVQKVFGRIGSTCQDPIPPQPPVAPPQA